MSSMAEDYWDEGIAVVSACFRRIDKFLASHLPARGDYEAQISVEPRDYCFRQLRADIGAGETRPLPLPETSWLHSHAIVEELKSIIFRLTGAEEFMVAVRPNSESKRFGVYIGSDLSRIFVSVQPAPESVAFLLLSVSDCLRRDILAGDLGSSLVDCSDVAQPKELV